MFLSELFEDTQPKHAAFCFGRMNPPTLGHQQLINTVAQTAQGGDFYIFTSQSQDNEKNPLDYKTKVQFLRALYPSIANHIVYDTNVKTIMHVAGWLYNSGYTAVTFVAGSDRIADFKELLTKYNGVEGKHNYYKFNQINFVSSGDRDADADGTEGISASAAREAAKAGNYKAFSQAVGAGKLTQQLYNAVRKGMNLTEAYPNQQMSLYNPDGTKYRQKKMPGYSPDDIYSRKDPVEISSEHEPYMAYKDQSRELGADDMIKRLLKSKLDLLEPQEKQIMYSRFYQDKTLEQIAGEYGLSINRVRQIEAKALRKLRHNMKDLEIAEDASGYIPKNKREAKDPRWSMALSVDVTPETPNKNARAFRLV